MSYIAKKGKAAAESATSEGGGSKNYADSLVKLKSGDTKFVRLATGEDYVEYFAASVFKVFYTTPVEPGNNPYQKAADSLYKLAKEQDNDDYRDLAYQIKPKPRYLFGFIDLDTGQPIVVDFTKNQAKTLIASIEKYSKKIGKIAFELSKTGEGTSTVVSLSPVLEMDEDLTDKQQEAFANAADTTIDDELYENVLYMKDATEQLDDIAEFAKKNGLSAAELGVDFEGEGAAADDPTSQF